MDSQLEDKLIKKSAVVAGIIFVCAVISISAFSQWNPGPATISSSRTQSPLKTNTLSSAPVPQSVKIPDQVPSSKTTTPIATSTPSSTIPNKFSTLPERQIASSKSSTPDDDATTPSRSSFSRKQTLPTASNATNSSSNQEDPSTEQVDDASATASGLLEAKRKGKIQPDTPMWRKAQTAISLLRQGKTRRQVARQAGISKATLKRLIESGQNRARAGSRGTKTF